MVMKEFAEVESNRMVAKAADTADKLEAIKPAVVKLMAHTVIANQLKSNSPKMMHHVVRLHQTEALGFAKNDEAVRGLLTKAAEQQSTDGRLVLGDAYLFGKYGFTPDAAKAATWFDRAIAVGGCDARYAVARLYLGRPEGVDKPLEKALRLLEESAAEGDLDAIRMLGKEHGPGGRLSDDDEKGIEYLNRLVKRGDTPGMVAFARRLSASAEKDPEGRVLLTDISTLRVTKATRAAESNLLLSVAAKRDNASAMMDLFTRYTTGKHAKMDEGMGLAYLRSAADLKDGPALCRLAEVYARGQHGVTEDPKEAVRCLREGIAVGSPECTFELGFATFRSATSFDFTDANLGYWAMRQAADWGHTEAQYQVGLSHLKPTTSRREEAESDVAELQSRPTGEFHIKGLFEPDTGSVRGKRGEDLKAARAWLELAAKQGHAKAKAALAELK